MNIFKKIFWWIIGLTVFLPFLIIIGKDGRKDLRLLGKSNRMSKEDIDALDW